MGHKSIQVFLNASPDAEGQAHDARRLGVDANPPSPAERRWKNRAAGLQELFAGTIGQFDLASEYLAANQSTTVSMGVYADLGVSGTENHSRIEERLSGGSSHNLLREPSMPPTDVSPSGGRSRP